MASSVVDTWLGRSELVGTCPTRLPLGLCTVGPTWARSRRPPLTWALAAARPRGWGTGVELFGGSLFSRVSSSATTRGVGATTSALLVFKSRYGGPRCELVLITFPT